MRVLLTGASGQLGAYVLPRLRAEGWDVRPFGGPTGGEFPPIDLADPASTRSVLDAIDPDAILHLAAISSADRAFREPALTRQVNVDATGILADWCGHRGRRLVYSSTDLVFDGSRPWNREDDPANPVLAYGLSKLDAESAVLAIDGGLVARLSLLYGPSRSGRTSYFDRTLSALRAGEQQSAFEDEFRTPLDLATAAEILARLVESRLSGLMHVGGAERVSRFDLLCRVTIALGLDADLVRKSRQADAASTEPRPADVSLDTSRLVSVRPDPPRPSIEDAARSWIR